MIDGKPGAAGAETETSEAPLTGEDQAWADLAAEMGDDGDESANDQGESAAAAGDDAGKEGEREAEGEKTEAAAKIPYEELERRQRQTSAALKEARDRERAANDQLKAYNEMVAEMRTARAQKQPEAKAEEPEEPNPYEDPIGYVNHHLAAIRKEVSASKETSQQVQQQQQQQEEYRQFTSTVEAAETAFASQTPDYHDAAKYLEDGRRAELSVMFPDTPQGDAFARQQGFQSAEQMRNAIFIQDAQTVAANALRAGMNPAEAYYSLAKARGYKAAPKQTTQEQNDKVIDMARRGKTASRTIGGSSGGAPDNPMSAADLADLYADDPEEFDKQWDKMARAGKLG